jgi:hypothetical protein
MNGVLPSLCLLGAALGTANVFIMQRPTCHVQGMEGAVAGGDVRLSKTVVLNIAKAEPANAPFRPKQPVVPKDVDVTGSVEQTKKTDVEVVSTAKAGAPNAVVSAGENVTGSSQGDEENHPGRIETAFLRHPVLAVWRLIHRRSKLRRDKGKMGNAGHAYLSSKPVGNCESDGRWQEAPAWTSTLGLTSDLQSLGRCDRQQIATLV